MVDRTIPYPEVGLATFEELDTYRQKMLLTSDYPPLKSFPMPMAASQTFQQFEVVGLNASGQLVPATWNATPASAVKPVGVVTQAVASGSGEAGKTVPVWFSGAFNQDILVWHSTFDTDAKKATAFSGSPSPTQITVRKAA
jgi:hypothetical protein